MKYKIHGAQRRDLKKKLSLLKRSVNNFWYYHNLDKTMAGFYEKSEAFPMNDFDAKLRLDQIKLEIEKIEIILSEVV